MTETMGPVEHRDNPYFGLDYYEEKFGSWFFGRKAEGGKIITNLRAARLTLLHAESGVGKSSLLRAGVAWRMQRPADDGGARRSTARFVPIVFSSWKDDPVTELAGTIRTAITPYLAERPVPKLPTDRLDTAIAEASDAANASLLIMLDQFEEYFLYRSREPVPERFADQLARCINQTDLRANFLIAIREDAYAGLGDLFKGRIANVYSNYLHVEYLDRACAEQAIREPLEVYNSQPGVSEHVGIQDELVEAVLDQVPALDGDGDAALGQQASNGGGRGRVSTPLLQLVMETVWQRERAEGSHELRLSTLQELRGVRMIVDAHLEKALSALSGGERQTAIDTFDHLVTPSGGKIAESVPDLAKRTGHNETQVGIVLDKLDHERIVRSIPAAPGQDPVRYRRYEIFHDVLAPTINRAIAAREEQRRTRRIQRLAALTVGGLLVALAVVGVFVYLWHKANTATAAAESRQLAAEANVTATRDPELSLMLALRALRLQDTSQAEDALRQALPETQAVRVFRTRTTASWAVFDPANPNEVASAGKDGSASIWNIKTGHRLLRLWPTSGFAGNGTANTVAFNQAGTQLAVGHGSGTVVLYSTSTGKELRSINVGATVNDVRFLDRIDGLAIAAQNGVHVWLPRDGLYKLTATQANSIAVDPQNPLELAVATNNGAVIWSLYRNSTTHRALPDQGIRINDVEFSPDGRKVVTADNYGLAWIYDVATLKETISLDAGEGTANSAAFSANGQLVVTAYKSGRTLVWDAAAGLKLTALVGNASTVYTARFSPTGSEVVTASGDGTIRVWQGQARELRTEFVSSSSGGTPNPVFTAQYSPGGGRLVVVDNSSSARVFTADGKPVLSGGHPVVLSPGGAYPNTAQFNRAGTEILTADSDGTVDLWHASGSDYTQIHLRTPIEASGGQALDAAFSPDGSRIAVVTNNDTAQVFSSQTGQLLRTLNPNHFFSLSVAVFSPSGHQVLTGDDNGQTEVWNATTGHEMRVLGKPGPAVNDVEFNKSGSEFVTASDSGMVTVWNAHGYQRVRSINACPSPSTASFSPDGSQIVVACGNGAAPVFATATGEQLTVLQGANVGELNSAVFSPNGARIVTSWDADDTGGVNIWSSELATTSLPELERMAQQRVIRRLTPAEYQQYLAGISG
jgi:WD40 repeat protein